VGKPELKSPILCLITDPAMPNLIEAVDIALAEGVNMLQLRGHDLPAVQLHRLAIYFGSLCQRYGVTFIINDRLDVGLAARVDGFQLGQQSLPPVFARVVVGDAYLLGASAHSLDEASLAVTMGADFLIAGTIFASRSHLDEPPSGPGLLSTIKQALPNYPLLAVGGLTAANAAQAMEAGADGIAVISAILGAPDIRLAVHELRRVIGL